MFTHTGCFCHVPRNGTQAVPYGFAGRWVLSSTQVIIATWRATRLPPLHAVGEWYRSTARVIFVTLYGDESSPLHCVVPFICTGCIRDVSGTAHRPFPTVSLTGLFFQPSSLKDVRFLPRAIKGSTPRNAKLSTVNFQLSTFNCQLSTVNSLQVSMPFKS